MSDDEHEIRLIKVLMRWMADASDDAKFVYETLQLKMIII